MLSGAASMILGEALGRAPGQGDLAQLRGRRPCRCARVRCAARACCSKTKHGGRMTAVRLALRAWSP